MHPNPDARLFSFCVLSPMIILEKYMGFQMSPVLERLAQYFLSNKMPLRIDLIRAIFTGAQLVGLVTCTAWLFEVSTLYNARGF